MSISPRMFLMRQAPMPRMQRGTLWIIGSNGLYQCSTLEPPVTTMNRSGIDPVPAGAYRTTLQQSDKHQMSVPLLLDTYPRSAIQIHILNHVGETKGCIGVGVEAPGGLTESQKTFQQFMEHYLSYVQVATPPPLYIIAPGQNVFPPIAVPGLELLFAEQSMPPIESHQVKQ